HRQGGPRPRGVARRSHPRRLPEDRPRGLGHQEPRGHAQRRRHRGGAAREAAPGHAGRAQEVLRLSSTERGLTDMGYDLKMRVWRGDQDGGELTDYTVEVSEGEVVLDALHRLQATQTGDLATRGHCKA